MEGGDGRGPKRSKTMTYQITLSDGTVTLSTPRPSSLFAGVSEMLPVGRNNVWVNAGDGKWDCSRHQVTVVSVVEVNVESC